MDLIRDFIFLFVPEHGSSSSGRSSIVEPVKAPEEKGGICGPTVVVLLAMVVLAFRRRRALS